MANKNIFCNVPWFHVNIRHDGTFEMCCTQRPNLKDDQGNPLFKHNIRNTTIAEWWNNDLIKQLRKNMLGDTPLPLCEGCYKDENSGNESYRLTHNWRSAIFTRQAFDESFEQSPHKIIFKEDGVADRMPIDFHIDLGSECNLACKFCHPEVSTRIATKFKSWGIWDQELRKEWVDDDALWERFLNELLDIKNLQSVHFMGGEPTLSPRLEQFVDFFLSRGRTNFSISFVTNGTRYLPRLVEKLANFKRIDIDISTESILDNNYYIRQGLDKELFRKNVSLYLSHRSPNFGVCLKPVVSALTVPTYPELIEFFYENDIITESNLCWEPVYLQIPVLPLSIRQSYMPKYEKLLAKLEKASKDSNADMVRSRMVENNAVSLYVELKSVYKMLQNPEPDNVEDLRKQLVYWLNKWDNDMGLDARVHYPEWTEFLESYGYNVSNKN
jgi:MoaA/NifB/PqqE/SkfB family radical SAM enzyme